MFSGSQAAYDAGSAVAQRDSPERGYRTNLWSLRHLLFQGAGTRERGGAERGYGLPSLGIIEREVSSSERLRGKQRCGFYARCLATGTFLSSPLAGSFKEEGNRVYSLCEAKEALCESVI